MGRKRSNTILLVLIIFIIILIALVGFAYCYFATDLLKSNKDLFFQYVGQIGNEENGFIDNRLKQYFEKQKNTPYTNEGEIFANFTSDGEELEEYKNVNNFNISFSGQVDKLGNKSTQDISLNYSDEVNFPISYKQIGDTIGLQTKYVSSKFIGVETDELSNITESTEITDLIENLQNIDKISQSPFTAEETQYIKEKYINILNTQLQETQFSKIEEETYTGYSLKLTGIEFKNILKQLLETLKNDEFILNKINKYLETQGNSTEISKESIDDYIKELDENEKLNEENFVFTVYEQKNAIEKITLEANTTKLTVEQKKDNNSINYVVTIIEVKEEVTATATINISYDGLSTMQAIDESYGLKVQIESAEEKQDEQSYSYKFKNSVTFTNDVNIDEFSDENSMMLTNYDSETVNKFLDSVVERIQLVNQKHMEQLGLEEDENPLIQIILPPVIYNQAQATIDNSNSMNELEISSHNANYQKYESTNLKAQTVKGLLSQIASYSGLDTYKIEEINFNGEEYKVNEQTIMFIRNEVKLDKTYRVEFEMDEDTGAIYRAVINEKVGE